MANTRVASMYCDAFLIPRGGKRSKLKKYFVEMLDDHPEMKAQLLDVTNTEGHLDGSLFHPKDLGFGDQIHNLLPNSYWIQRHGFKTPHIIAP